jgi:hypothetical protein
MTMLRKNNLKTGITILSSTGFSSQVSATSLNRRSWSTQQEAIFLVVCDPPMNKL